MPEPAPEIYNPTICRTIPVTLIGTHKYLFLFGRVAHKSLLSSRDLEYRAEF
jgi:hypothetical protein